MTKNRKQKSVVRRQPKAPSVAEGEQLQLLAAIWRTEANITVTERSLADLRTKHHNQCAELVRMVRRSTLNPKPSTGKK